MKRDPLNKTAKCTPCIKVGKYLKHLFTSTKCKPIKPCSEPNEEIQLDFGGTIYNERNQKTYFLACLDRFSKFPMAETFEQANPSNAQIYL